MITNKIPSAIILQGMGKDSLTQSMSDGEDNVVNEFSRELAITERRLYKKKDAMIIEKRKQLFTAGHQTTKRARRGYSVIDFNFKDAISNSMNLLFLQKIRKSVIDITPIITFTVSS
jgi:hypothetical protein